MALYANNLSNNYPEISGIIPLFVTNGGERWDGGTGVVYDEGIPIRWGDIADGSTIYMLEGQEEGTGFAITKSGSTANLYQVGRGFTAWQTWGAVYSFSSNDYLMITKPIDDDRLIIVQGVYDSENKTIRCYKSLSGRMYGDLDYFYGWHLKEYDPPAPPAPAFANLKEALINDKWDY